VRALGAERFARAYEYLKAVQSEPEYASEDEATLLQELTRILGAEHVRFWKLLDQLLFVEANC
jgi:hypothetical protein